MTDAWDLLWSDATGRFRAEGRQIGPLLMHRFRTTTDGYGAVVVVRRDGATLFVTVDRPAVGRRLLELPRGMSEPEDTGGIGTAARELHEETGFELVDPMHHGVVYPDSGLLADAVHVVAGSCSTTTVAPPEHGTTWLTDAEIRSAIVAGELRDAISLAALAVVGA